MFRLLSTARARTALLSGALLALSACGRHEPLQSVLAQRCMPISAARPVDLNIVSNAPGTLRVAVLQRGISVVVSSGGRQPRASISPIDRFGVATLTLDVSGNQLVPIAIRAHDSPDIVGEVCVSADRLPQADTMRMRAERAFAAAGQSAHAQRWQDAFNLYRTAARDFDTLDRQRAAQARHAMSSIDYGHLREDDGAYVLAAWARADFGPGADPGLQSSLFALQASTILESHRFSPQERQARVLDLLRLAEERAHRSPFGARETARFEILRGFVDFYAEQPAEAGKRFTRAAEQCETLRDWECAARAQQNLAALAEEARDYPAALQAYRRALNVLPPELDLTLSADIWGNYGRLQSMSGLFRAAEISHRTSLRLHARLGDCDGTRIDTGRLGALLMQVGNISEGRLYLGRAASLACPKLIEVASHDADSADADAVMASTRRAPVCLDQPAARTLSEVGQLAVFSALLGLHDVARLNNDTAQGERCLASAHDYATTARMRLRLANAEGAFLIERREPAKAEAAFQRGLSIADGAKLSPTHENRSVAYLGLARAALLQGHPLPARGFAARAMTLGAARGDLRQVTDALQLTARTFSAEKDTTRAASILRVAADLIEQVPIDDLDAEQRATWLATQHAVFAELTTLVASEAGTAESGAWQAFEVSERGRARSIRYAVSQASDQRSMSSSEPASERYRELMRRITELGREAQSTDIQSLSIDRLAETVGVHAAVPAGGSFAMLQQQLAALDATIVEYAAGQESMLAFVVNGQHIRVVPLGSRADIAAAALDMYEHVRNPESAASDVRRSAEGLARLVLWPLADLLSGKRVIFIPDDSLHTVPFAVLPESADRDAPPIIQRLELSVMPSTVFITRAGASPPRGGAAPRLELIGDPVFRAADWREECHRMSVASGTVFRGGSEANGLPALPGSRAEVSAIAELAHRYTPQNEVHQHLRCEATPQALRDAAASNPVLLHIATHGYVDAYRPRLSALVLTPDTPANGGRATVGLLDILQMKISSRLVVLSACETSRGQLLPGEGVLGPAQAFLQAGAASVVASYWRIPDESTARFMRTFYRYLLVDHLSAAAALREAQLEYVRAADTYDWAAFALFGWPNSRL
jgi:CHAT domain-containing protein/tetratricopeptide (TPR) repeat protein